MSPNRPSLKQLSSGIVGLDELLHGGYLKNRMYLVTGDPGTGKTTLCFHFLQAGLGNGERTLCIHGEESAAEIRENAAQFGIDLDDVEFLDLGPDSGFFTEDRTYDLVDAGSIENEQHTQRIHDAIEAADPERLVLDPITQLRYIEPSDYHYRKRLLSLIRYLKEREITVLGTATDDAASPTISEVRSISDGVIRLNRSDQGRRIEVEKNRGVGQITGDHGLEIRPDGVEVFARLPSTPESDGTFESRPVGTGISELDGMIGGGFERGTVTFLSGPPGIGKTTIGTLFLTEAAKKGEPATIYLLEERAAVYRHRCRSIGLPIDRLESEGTLRIRRIEPMELSAEEFAHEVRTDVLDRDVALVMIDGFSGYTSSLQGSIADLTDDLHTLSRHLDALGVAVFVTDTIHQITGISLATSRSVSPIADNILFLTYVELEGSLSRVLGVLKKRTGGFEMSLREFEIAADGVRVGEPLGHLHGLLGGSPRPVDEEVGRSADGSGGAHDT